MRSFTAIRKGAGLFCGSFARKGEVEGPKAVYQKGRKESRDLRINEKVWCWHIKQNRNLNDLKDSILPKDMLGDGMGCQNQSKHFYLNKSFYSEYSKLVSFTSFSEFPEFEEHSDGTF